MNGKIKDAFDSVHAEEDLKEKTKAFVFSKMEANQPKKFFPSRRLLSAAACCFLLLLGVFGFGTYFTPVSAISVDINPSVELSLNRFDRVVSVHAFNDDGETLKDSLNIKYMNYIDALDCLFEDDTVKEYIEQDEIVSITVVSQKDTTREAIMEEVRNCTLGQNNIYCYSADSEEVAQAHDAGLSYGKYKAFLELQKLDSSISVQDVQGLSMKEIRNWIDLLSGNSQQDNSSASTDIQSGNGQKFRNGQNSDSGQGSANGQNSGNGQGFGNGQNSGNGQGSANGQNSGNGQGFGNGNKKK